MKKVMERTRDNIFCRLPALLLCALLECMRFGR